MENKKPKNKGRALATLMLAVSLTFLGGVALTGCSSTPEQVGEQTQKMDATNDKLIDSTITATVAPKAGDQQIAVVKTDKYRHDAFMQQSKIYPINTPYTAERNERQDGWFCFIGDKEYKFVAGSTTATEIEKPTSDVGDMAKLSDASKAELDPSKDPQVMVKVVTTASTAVSADTADGQQIDASIQRYHTCAAKYDNVRYFVVDPQQQKADFVKRQGGWFSWLGDSLYEFAPGNQTADAVPKPVVTETTPRKEKLDGSDTEESAVIPSAGAISPDKKHRDLVLRHMFDDNAKFKYETVRYPLLPDTIIAADWVKEQNGWDNWLNGRLYRINNDAAGTVDELNGKPTITDNTDHAQQMPGTNRALSGYTYSAGPLLMDGRRNLIIHNRYVNEQLYQDVEYFVPTEISTDLLSRDGSSCVWYDGSLYHITSDGGVEQRTERLVFDVTGDPSFVPLFTDTQLTVDVSNPIAVDEDTITCLVRRSFQRVETYDVLTYSTESTVNFPYDSDQQGWVYVINGITYVIPIEGSSVQRQSNVTIVQTPYGFRFPRVLYSSGNGDSASAGHTTHVPDANDFVAPTRHTTRLPDPNENSAAPATHRRHHHRVSVPNPNSD